ncbi:hypothetical protein N8725_02735 [Alphaproteobacteria bacterium]|nr:hypothetical protein [Alphaproteobacteria bacterium]
MDKINTKTFYDMSKLHLKNEENTKVPSSVFRQELATWEHTDNGIKRTTIVRSFNGNGQIDSCLSEPIAFKKNNNLK